MKRILTIALLFIGIANVMTQDNTDSVIFFKDYKQFIFYTRDSIARHILGGFFDDFAYNLNNDDIGILKWDAIIDYRDEEILDVLTYYCDFYEPEYLYSYVQGKLIVNKDLLIYMDTQNKPIKIFPELIKLNKSLSVDTNLSIYNNWNKKLGKLDISQYLLSEQIGAYRNWRKTLSKGKIRKLNKTYTPSRINCPCDSTFDYRSRLYRNIIKKNENSYEVLYFNNQKDLLLKGYYSSIFPENKDGQFRFYNNNALMYKGYYRKNFPIGKWLQYDNSGNVVKEVDYSEVLEKLSFKETYSEIFTIDQVDSLPRLSTKRFNDFTTYISENFFYPPYRSFDPYNYNNIIQFDISVDGKIENIKLIEGFSNEFNIEIIRLLLESPEWIPAKKDGKPVVVRMTMPFEY